MAYAHLAPLAIMKFFSSFRGTLRGIFTRSHTEALLASSLFDATFSDSGHWDFALLSITETFCRTVIVYTWGPISETTIAEKAGWLPAALSQATTSPLSASHAKGFSAAAAALLEGTLAISLILAALTFGVYFL